METKKFKTVTGEFTTNIQIYLVNVVENVLQNILVDYIMEKVEDKKCRLGYEITIKKLQK